MISLDLIKSSEVRIIAGDQSNCLKKVKYLYSLKIGQKGPIFGNDLI